MNPGNVLLVMCCTSPPVCGAIPPPAVEIQLLLVSYKTEVSLRILGGVLLSTVEWEAKVCLFGSYLGQRSPISRTSISRPLGEVGIIFNHYLII